VKSNAIKNNSLKIIIGVAISLALAGYLLSTLEWQAVGAHIESMRWWPWLGALLFVSIHFALRAVRWSYLFPGPTDKRSLMLLTDTMMIGNLASYILPLRAGEFIRPAAYAKLSSTQFLPAFTTVVVERLFDLVAVLLSLGLVSMIVPNMPAMVVKAGLILGLGAIALSIFVAIGVLKPALSSTIVHTFTKFLPSRIAAKIMAINDQVLLGVAALREPGRLLKVTLLTIAVWAFAYAQFWVCLYAFDIPGSGVLMAVTVAVVLALGVAAPSAPGFVGVYEVSCLLGFRLFGVNDELAAAYAITTHAFQYIVVIGYGVYALLKYNLKLADFRHKNPAPISAG